MNVHLSPALLARLADHGESGLSRGQRDHLASCRHCRDAVFEAEATSREFRARKGLAAPASMVATILASTSGSVRPRVARRRWAAIVGLPMAAVLVFLIVSPVVDPPPLAPELVGPIAGVLADRHGGAMVFPGAVGEPEAGPALRGIAEDSALVASVQALADRYHDSANDPSAAMWLIGGYLALDEVSTARTFATDALRRYPDAETVLVAAAVVAYRGGEFERAQALLQDAIAAGDTEPATLLNLAIVQLDLGHADDALPTLQQLAGHAPSAVAARAAAILARHGDE